MAEEGKAVSETNPTKTGSSKVAMFSIVFGLVCVLAAGFLFIKSNQSAPPHPPPILYDLGEVITNLSATSEHKYVKTKVILEIGNQSLEKELDENEPLLRDSIIHLLNDRTSNDIMSGRDKLKADAVSQINKHLYTGQVTNIYFSDLILQ
jgi:flagellar basal body-associated protein FliL